MKKTKGKKKIVVELNKQYILSSGLYKINMIAAPATR
jgi:hypothetical protein